MAASLFTQITLAVAGVAILVILYLGGLSRSLKGATVEIAIVVAAALVIVAIGHLKP